MNIISVFHAKVKKRGWQKMKRALIIALCAAVLTLTVPMILSFDVEKAGAQKQEETAVSETEAAGGTTKKQEEKETEKDGGAKEDQSELITIFEG